MARIPRLFIDSACYHIITRGNQKQPVFEDNEDYEKYLQIVKKAKRKYGILIFAYCLMLNHVHMLLKGKIPTNISKFMHWVNRGYTAYFNEKYGKVGHLWQARYKSKPIVKDNYMVSCAEYIEGNPARAGIVKDVADYEWSSYRERCLLSEESLLDDINEHI